MGIQELFSLEIEGITKTISEYSTNHFINSYTKQVMQLSLPNDKEKIRVIVSRLIDWYTLNIDNIKRSNFIVNKEDHELSLKLLKDIRNRLDEIKSN